MMTSVKRIIQKKVVRRSLIITGSVFAAALLYFILIPLFLEGRGIIMWPGDPFWAAIDEYDELMDSILIPLYPDPGPWGKRPDSKTITLYFKENDFTEELGSLDGLYEKTAQGDKNSLDQRKKARRYRGDMLITMKEKIDTIHAAMEIIRRHIEENSGVFTKEEDEALWNFMRLRSLPMTTH